MIIPLLYEGGNIMYNISFLSTSECLDALLNKFIVERASVIVEDISDDHFVVELAMSHITNSGRTTVQLKSSSAELLLVVGKTLANDYRGVVANISATQMKMIVPVQALSISLEDFSYGEALVTFKNSLTEEEDVPVHGIYNPVK
jgi:hypothetical protein